MGIFLEPAPTRQQLLNHNSLGPLLHFEDSKLFIQEKGQKNTNNNCSKRFFGSIPVVVENANATSSTPASSFPSPRATASNKNLYNVSLMNARKSSMINYRVDSKLLKEGSAATITNNNLEEINFSNEKKEKETKNTELARSIQEMKSQLSEMLRERELLNAERTVLALQEKEHIAVLLKTLIKRIMPGSDQNAIENKQFLSKREMSQVKALNRPSDGASTTYMSVEESRTPVVNLRIDFQKNEENKDLWLDTQQSSRQVGSKQEKDMSLTSFISQDKHHCTNSPNRTQIGSVSPISNIRRRSRKNGRSHTSAIDQTSKLVFGSQKLDLTSPSNNSKIRYFARRRASYLVQRKIPRC